MYGHVTMQEPEEHSDAENHTNAQTPAAQELC